ncbi:MAG: SCO family protein [Promethearchaeota archaeon]
MEMRNVFILIPGLAVLIAVLLGAFVIFPLLNPALPVIREAPDFTLINQDRENVSLNQFEGKVVMLGFIYTFCPDPEFCILMSSDFKTLQDNLGTRMGSEVILLLITLDPERDTPEALKIFGENYGADFSGWQFLTGDNETIQQVMEDYKVIAFKEPHMMNDTHDDHMNMTMEDHYIIVHNWVSVLIDQDGMVRQEYGKLDWNVAKAETNILSLLQ